MHFFRTYPFLIPLFALFLAESLKVLITSVQQKHFSAKTFLHSGGMPSGHSTLVSSLATIVCLKNGVHSVEFAIAMVMAIVVLYDAVSIRWQAGKHAKILNQLQNEKKLDERLGHTYWQMLAGTILGITVSVGLYSF